MSYHVDRVGIEEVRFADFLDFLQKKNTHALGFLTHVAQVEAIRRGCVLRAWENGEPCGWMIHGKIRETTRILQCVVQDDARRVQHATALVDSLTLLANEAKAHRLLLHCAEDLESNAFWQAVGFTKVGRRLKRKDGRRWQNRYEILLPALGLSKIEAKKALEQVGLSRLYELLSKGNASIASVNFTRHRAARHQLDLGEGVDAD